MSVSSEISRLSAVKPLLVQRESPLVSCSAPEKREPLFTIKPSEMRKPSPSSSPVAYGPWKRSIRPVPDIELNLRTIIPLQAKLLPAKEETEFTAPVRSG